jgi:hypothetical protein
MCGMFMYSSDAGNTWSIPERFTPITSPLLDWRYVSIIPVSPVNNDFITVHLVMQGDPMPGSTLNGWSLMPPSISAQYYHFSNEPLVINVEDEHSVISSFKLEQNYPNPFNPSTKISWQSPVGSWQSLKVYDILGREITALVDEYKSAGNYEVEFSTLSIKHLPSSGVYFYTLRAGDFIQTKKMILMK